MPLARHRLEYPGYGISNTGGTPSENSVARDAEIVFDFITTELGWDASAVIPFGRSIGTGPASRLAASRPAGGCVLVSPYTSIRGMVGALVSEYLTWLVSDRFVTVEEVAMPGYPDLLIFHGTHDELIPFSQGEKVHESCRARRKAFVPLDGCGHNDVYDYAPLSLMKESFCDFFADLQRSKPARDLAVPPHLFVAPDPAEAGSEASGNAGGVLSQLLETSASASSSIQDREALVTMP